MVNNIEKRLNTMFSAMADPTRRGILSQLAGGVRTAGELAAPFDISLPAISRHLRVLENAGLISRQIEGRIHFCHLEATPMKEAADWLSVYRIFWEERLDALGAFLAEPELGEDEDGESEAE